MLQLLLQKGMLFFKKGVWAASLDVIFLRFFETFCEHVPWNKLSGTYGSKIMVKCKF
jgi:hypothetical protein